MNTLLKYGLVLITAITLFGAVAPKDAYAAQNIARTSASLSGAQAITISYKEHDNRAEILKGYLAEQNSPLAEHAQTFIDEADKNHLDWKLVAAIAGDESGFGLQIPGYSYNGWGYGVYGNNVRYFNSWDDGIATVSKAIRTDYLYDSPETNVYQIGAKYAADPMWAGKVTNYMNQIEAYATRQEKPSLSISI
jgi:hypothetical protein